MKLPQGTQRRIERLKAAMRKEPIRDGAAGGAGRERAAIAALYLGAGDVESAGEWYLLGARFAAASGDPCGAVALVRGAVRLRPGWRPAVELYGQLWRLLGLGDSPEPVGDVVQPTPRRLVN